MTSAQSSRQKLGRKLINTSAVLGLLYLFAPIVVIVLFSFNEPKGKYNIVWQGFTLDNWAHREFAGGCSVHCVCNIAWNPYCHCAQ